MSTKYLVTGGAGFIGTNLVKVLVELGNEVVVADDLSTGDKSRLPDAVDFYELNICNTKELENTCEGVDVVVHLAALPSVPYSIEHPIESHSVNVDGTLSVLEVAKSAQVKRVVFASSSAVYGNQEQIPHSVEMLPAPESPYALHKLVGEQMMKLWSELYDIETVSLRFFNVYGPYFNPEGPYAAAIGKFVTQVKAGKEITVTGDGKQTRDFVHVSDVVEAIIKSASSDKVGEGEVLNIGSGTSITINELAKMIGEDIVYIEERKELKHSLADIDKTIDLLDWQPSVSIETGIKELTEA